MEIDATVSQSSSVSLQTNFVLGRNELDTQNDHSMPSKSFSGNARDTKIYGSRFSEHPIHAEVCVCPFNCHDFSLIETHVVEFLRHLGPRHVPTVLNRSDNDFDTVSFESEVKNLFEIMNQSVDSINLILDEADGIGGNDTGRSVDLCTVPILVHVYQLINGDEALPVQETMQIGSECVNGGTTWLLPSMEMKGLWESLVFDSDIKLNLLQYAKTALSFADRQVSSSVITWNRVILLYGPPGTGKTSLCRAFANKLAIRMADRYSSTQLIEINTMNLMSKWFSESARLVARMFDTIKEYLESSDHLVCLLIDEVESLTAIRNSSLSGCEPSDAIRVVNAVLTQIDQIKRYPNVLILTTSNVTGVIDPAFLDRADIRFYLGNPSPSAIYTIYRSCLIELSRTNIVNFGNQRLLSYRSLAAMQFTETKENSTSIALWNLAKQSFGLNGRTLRKLPLLAHAFYLDKVLPSRNYNVLFTNQIHLPLKPESDNKENQTSDLNSSISASDHSSNDIKTVSLRTFIEALNLSVIGHLTEVKTLDSASSTRLGTSI